MSEKVRVASRTVRRGRKVRARTVPPPAHRSESSSAVASEASAGTQLDVSSEPAPRSHREQTARKPKYYSRPPAPTFAFEKIADDVTESSTSSELSRGESSDVGVEVAIVDAQAAGNDLDGSFFVKESLAPVAFAPEAPPRDEPSPASTDDWLRPEELQRRSSLRRAVGAVVGMVAVAALGLSFKATDKSDGLHAAPAAANPGSATGVTVHAQSEGAPVGDMSEPVAEKTEPKQRPSSDSAAEEQSDSDAELTGLDSTQLRLKVIRLLNQGKFELAIPYAERLVEQEPEHAFGYRCLGAAYQDLGRLKDARRVYKACAETAKRGRVIECSQLRVRFGH